MKKQVKCPICGRRLFDVKENSTGLVEIKCPKCSKISQVRLYV